MVSTNQQKNEKKIVRESEFSKKEYFLAEKCGHADIHDSRLPKGLSFEREGRRRGGRRVGMFQIQEKRYQSLVERGEEDRG